MGDRVNRQKFTDVSEEGTISIFKEERISQASK
jgi:hypothetical protein